MYQNLFTLIVGWVPYEGVSEGRFKNKAMTKKRSLNEYRQEKTYGYETEIISQTDKVNKKINDIMQKSHEKLNYGTNSEKQIAIGSIQLINELHRLTTELPNDQDLGKNIREIFVLR